MKDRSAGIDLNRLMAVDSAQNAVSRGTADRLERWHPGFRVLAGPYVVVTKQGGPMEQAEQAACVRALRDQQRAGCEAKIVMVGAVAFVLRSAEGWRMKDDVLNEEIRGPVDVWGKGGRD